MDERTCPKHEGGEHCWHRSGQPGFRGLYETSFPVECCHCQRKARKRESGSGWIDYNAVSEFDGTNT